MTLSVNPQKEVQLVNVMFCMFSTFATFLLISKSAECLRRLRSFPYPELCKRTSGIYSECTLMPLYAKRRTKIVQRVPDFKEPEGNDEILNSETQEKIFNSSRDTIKESNVGVFEDEILRDLSSYNSKISSKGGEKVDNFFKIKNSVKDFLSIVLVADFVAVLIFLLWFLAASVAKVGFTNPYLLERFQDIFQPIIQPALGILMIGSILSGLLGKENDDK